MLSDNESISTNFHVTQTVLKMVLCLCTVCEFNTMHALCCLCSRLKLQDALDVLANGYISCSRVLGV